MARLRGGSIPGYRMHCASGQAVVTLSGQDFYLGPHGTAVSKREYDRVVTEWLARGRRPQCAVEQHSVEMTVSLATVFSEQTTPWARSSA